MQLARRLKVERLADCRSGLRRLNFCAIFILCVCVLSTVSGPAVSAKAKEPQHVLVAYDSLAADTARQGNIEALKRVLAAFGVNVTITSFDRYEPGSLAAFSYVIGVQNRNDLDEADSAFMRDLAFYKGAYLHIGSGLPPSKQELLAPREEYKPRETASLSVGQLAEPSITIREGYFITSYDGEGYGEYTVDGDEQTYPFGVRNGSTAYVPYYEQGNISELAISYLLRDWLRQEKQTGLYVLFKEIYPFSNLDHLRQLADSLYDAGIPFIVSVRPVFSNTDYPATKRYLEALKHVQSRNGSVIVHAPNVSAAISQDMMTLDLLMADFVNVLADYGIAPLGVGAEIHWTYDRHFSAKGMGAFDSNVLFPDEKIRHVDWTDTSAAFSSSLYTMEMGAIDGLQRNSLYLEPFPMDTALVLDFPSNGKELDRTIGRLKEEWTSFGDYKNGSHLVRTEKHRISSRDGMLYLDGQALALSAADRLVNSEYEYVAKGEKSFEKLFTLQNKILIALILLALIIFGCFLIIGYRMYKRKYVIRRHL